MDKQAVLKQIREEAFRDEMEKMALSDPLLSRVAQKLDIKNAAEWLSGNAHPIVRKNTRSMIKNMLTARGEIRRFSKETDSIRQAYKNKTQKILESLK